MAEIKKQVTQNQAVTEKPVTKHAVTATTLFTRENYKWMAIGGAIIILGMILLSGGKNQDPNTFDPKVVYSTTRITVAPFLIIIGLMVEIYAIFRKPKQTVNA
jgi:hypothetical protein